MSQNTFLTNPGDMNILHTSDWHLGCSLYGHKRYREHDAFLDWLIATISARDIEVLLVAGDIFDSTLPSNRALAQYYQFLYRVSATCCRHVVITGGNHDSPSLLAAPKDLLKHLNIHVVSAINEAPEEEVIAIDDADGALALIVCAVPYLRDRQIRTAQAGESVEDKGRKLVDGISSHYHDVCRAAEAVRDGKRIPLVVMGHLFAAGGRVDDNDGERELYVGSLAHVPVDRLPPGIDYLALGHLHRAQSVGGRTHYRYSGSPLPMSFSGADRAHSVCLLNFTGTAAHHQLLEVPVFRNLFTIRGGRAQITARLEEIRKEFEEAWIEVHYTGDRLAANLQQEILQDVAGTGLEIIRVINNRIMSQTLAQATVYETLDMLSPEEVFKRCLESHAVPEDQRPLLLNGFREIVRELDETDTLAQ